MAFGPGPHLIWGPNAAGKTSLLEAVVLLAWARSHRTSADGELVRWGTDLARIEGQVARDTLEVAVVRAGATGTAGRKRIRVNGLGRRASGLGALLRVVVFAPEDMLLIAGSPSLRRAVIDQLAVLRLAGLRGRPGDVWPDAPAAQQPAPGDPRGRRLAGRAPLSGTAPSSTPAERSWPNDAGCSRCSPVPLAEAHAEIAPEEAAEARLTLALCDERSATPRGGAA